MRPEILVYEGLSYQCIYTYIHTYIHPSIYIYTWNSMRSLLLEIRRPLTSKHFIRVCVREREREKESEKEREREKTVFLEIQRPQNI